MVDASRGFVKDGNKNRLREQDIRKIVDVFNQQLVIPHYSRLVPISEITKNDYNLNLPRYIDSQEIEDIQDIEAHLQGGIPKADIEGLADYWEIYPQLKQELFTPQRDGYLNIKIPTEQVKKYVFEHPEFTEYASAIAQIFNQWWNENLPNLKGIKQGDNPKPIIRSLAESLLTAFENRNLEKNIRS
ncbi:N-6 DNA methylase [Dactylococcopsis salina]|uniref:N-6 DNA methylase n=1 Tax=Dactylococcopsis salina TaxID=292566 RepID=UPI0002DE4262|nr:N-6 DNA methylase [Dactylococcopsis salina]